MHDPIGKCGCLLRVYLCAMESRWRGGPYCWKFERSKNQETNGGWEMVQWNCSISSRGLWKLGMLTMALNSSHLHSTWVIIYCAFRDVGEETTYDSYIASIVKGNWIHQLQQYLKPFVAGTKYTAVSENEIWVSDFRSTVEDCIVVYWAHFIAENVICRQFQYCPRWVLKHLRNSNFLACLRRHVMYRGWWEEQMQPIVTYVREHSVQH